MPEAKKKLVLKLANDIVNYVKRHNLDCVVVFGVDCNQHKDQLAIALSKNGILSIGRKFHPTKDEQGYIRPAENFNDVEMGYNRYFDVAGKKFYLAVCYDGFGVRQCNITNTEFDAILILVHQFHKRVEAISGDVDFARKGFAGASLHWNCPAFGTAVFFDRDIPANWPTGVIYHDAQKGVKHFKYKDNELHWEAQDSFPIGNELALCRLFYMP